MKVYMAVTDDSVLGNSNYVFSSKERAQAYCDFVNDGTVDGIMNNFKVQEVYVDEVRGADRNDFGLWLLDRAMGVGDE